MSNWAWPIATVISVTVVSAATCFVFYLANRDKED